MSTIQTFKPLYKATPLMRELVERTEPKLPTITNKNLTVLPWDWELPSIILKSEWAAKHKQCYQAASMYPDKFCAIGLLMHYYGWNGGGKPYVEDEFLNMIDEQIYFTCNSTTQLGYSIIHMNDDCKCSFFEIGERIEWNYK